MLSSSTTAAGSAADTTIGAYVPKIGDGLEPNVEGASIAATETPQPRNRVIQVSSFGDPDGKGLYITAMRSVYHIRMKKSAW